MTMLSNIQLTRRLTSASLYSHNTVIGSCDNKHLTILTHSDRWSKYAMIRKEQHIKGIPFYLTEESRGVSFDSFGSVQWFCFEPSLKAVLMSLGNSLLSRDILSDWSYLNNYKG